jgi:hypothetical protein
MRVVGVHGIGNLGYLDRAGSPEAAATAMAADWQGWLEAGVAAAGLDAGELEVTAAYYSQHLRRGTAQAEGDLAAALSPEEQLLLVEWVEALQLTPQIAQGPRTARARQAADWLTRRVGPAARFFVAAFCREVQTYLASTQSPRRAAARDTVSEVIVDTRPHVVVAHSLGSVVAYEALWDRPDLRVDLLVTIGSPLAMPGVVVPRLLPRVVRGRGRRPPGVGRWVNLADVGDIVAVPRSGLSGVFDEVEDLPPLTIGAWDFHTSQSYLRSPEVARVVVSSA